MKNRLTNIFPKRKNSNCSSQYDPKPFNNKTNNK